MTQTYNYVLCRDLEFRHVLAIVRNSDIPPGDYRRAFAKHFAIPIRELTIIMETVPRVRHVPEEIERCRQQFQASQRVEDSGEEDTEDAIVLFQRLQRAAVMIQEDLSSRLEAAIATLSKAVGGTTDEDEEMATI